MTPAILKPEKAQQTFWLASWAVWLVIGLVLAIIPGLISAVFYVRFNGGLISALSVAGWLLFTLPYALYIPAFYRSLEYSLEDDAIRANKGVFWRKRVTIPYFKITNIDITQGPVQRMFNIGNIHVQTAGAGGAQGARAELKLWGISDLDGLKNTIMQKVTEAVQSAPGTSRRKAAIATTAGIDEKILDELVAIRQLLTKRSDLANG